MLPLLLTAALAGPAAAVPPHVEQARAQIDWDAAGAEVAELLSVYIQTDTRNPPGNEALGVLLLGTVLDAEGIPWTEYPLDGYRSSLVARLEGSSDEPALCLMSHIDVVDAEPEHWSVDPLSGVIRDGQLYGRGVLDMKGMGILELQTLVWLQRLGVPLRRDVMLIAVAGEEVNGEGMRDLAEDHWDAIGCGHMINEGGLGLVEGSLFDGVETHAISIAEKGVAWIRVHATGRAGHGSTPYPGEAPDRLQRAMAALAAYKPKPRLHPAFYDFFKQQGRVKGGLTGAVLRSRLLVDLLVRPRLMKLPATRAAITNTIHLTGVSGAQEPNVVPSAVWAQYDCRLLPGVRPEEMLALFERLLDGVEGLELELVYSEIGNGSPWDDPVYGAIARYAVEGRPSAAAGPVVSTGFTDSMFARPLGVRAYGYVPFVLTEEVASTMHGHDERIDLDNLQRGLRVLFSIVIDQAGTPLDD